jgi:hypothetical protein
MTAGCLAQPVRASAERMKQPLFQQMEPGRRIPNAEQAKVWFDTTTSGIHQPSIRSCDVAKYTGNSNRHIDGV